LNIRLIRPNRNTFPPQTVANLLHRRSILIGVGDKHLCHQVVGILDTFSDVFAMQIARNARRLLVFKAYFNKLEPVVSSPIKQLVCLFLMPLPHPTLAKKSMLLT
jgi:hypothetical protein